VEGDDGAPAVTDDDRRLVEEVDPVRTWQGRRGELGYGAHEDALLARIQFDLDIGDPDAVPGEAGEGEPPSAGREAHIFRAAHCFECGAHRA
jgi:hypothetical protein